MIARLEEDRLHKSFRVVAYIDLSERNESVAEDLDFHEKSCNSSTPFVGVRMIVNHHESDSSITWPQVSRDFVAMNSENSTFRET